MTSDVRTGTGSAVVSSVSWVNRATGFIDRLPLPGPAWYLAAGLCAILLFILNDWLALGRPTEAMQPFHLVLALDPIYALALMHLLDVRAGRALARMRPLLFNPEVYEELRLRLTLLPARLTMVASLVGLAIGLVAVAVERTAMPEVFRPFLPAANARPFVEVWLAMTWFVFGALFVHTVHQLRVISHIYTHHTRIDLDNYQPLFHFSTVSALTAIGLLVIPYAWSVGVPNLLSDPVGVAFGAFFPVFALFAFLWPLIGVHNLIVEAKGKALLENAAVLKDVRQRLFAHAGAGALGGASDLKDALEAIRRERDALLHVPAWPWQPGTPRSVVAALLLPLAVWFLQWVLQKLLGS